MAVALFLEVAGVLGLAAILSVLTLVLRQPLIVAFLATGILAGPAALNIVDAGEPFRLLAEIGIVLLLFYVGMKLDPRELRQLGRIALMLGTAQVVLTSLLGFFLARALGFDLTESAYLGVAISFSSTIVIVKLLSDKRETETLYGRLAVGLLVVQDIWVIVVLVGLSLVGASGGTDDGSLVWDVVRVLVSGALLLVAVYAVMRWVFPRLLDALGRSRELLVLFSVAWGITLAAASDWGGLSAELGGFVAGVALSASEYREAIASRIVSLRDFMLLFFFIILGAGLDLGLVRELLVPALVLSGFVFFGKPLLVLSLFAVAGFRRRISFLTGAMMGQVSEFGLILGTLGVGLGHIDARLAGLLTLVAFTTIIASTYVIEWKRPLYGRLRPLLKSFERRSPTRGSTIRGLHDERDRPRKTAAPQVLVFGLGRFGADILARLSKSGYRAKGVDLDPRQVARARRQGFDATYGDAEDPDFPQHLPLREVGLVVSTIPQVRANRILRHALRTGGYEGPLFVTAHWDDDAARLREEDFAHVLLPFHRAAGEATEEVQGHLGPPNPMDEG